MRVFFPAWERDEYIIYIYISYIAQDFCEKPMGYRNVL